MNFDDKEASVLNYIQHSVPMVRRPFAAIGNDLGISESEVMDIIEEYKNRRIIRNIAAIFNPQSLGYAIGLVGIEVPERLIENAVAHINGHPGVSHNYLRNHRINIWFTLADEDETRFRRSAKLLAHTAGANDTLVLKTEQVFKIGVRLPVGKMARTAEAASETQPGQAPKPGDLTPVERIGISLLQLDLPIVEQPFSRLAGEANNALSQDRLIEIGRLLQTKGTMRRYAAALKHMEAGFTHNAMTVWKLADDAKALTCIDAFIQEKAVSHLYSRTIYPGKWEYPLFAMIHAKSDDALAHIVHRLSSASGILDYVVLRSLREFKKRRVTYFSNEFGKWHEKMAPAFQDCMAARI
jgi:DNA-binding Lrp family transcriptional regulator